MNARMTWISAGITYVVAAPWTAVAQLSPQDIAALRERGKAEGWTFAVAESDATRRPLHELCGAVEPPDWPSTAVFDNRPARRDLPPAFDWRDYEGCTPIRDQDGCGSCWAFGAMGTVESMLLINESLATDLSEQWLVSCTDAGTCSGGWHTRAYEYLEISGLEDPWGDSGAVLEADFPYVAWNAPCGGPYAHPHSIFSWAVRGPRNGEATVDQIKQAIMDYGPVSTCVYVNDAFHAYAGGVFNACEYRGINHVVDLVGWDDNQGVSGVWILRNSWNTWWGEDGYMLIEYGCSRIGYCTCYVNYSATDCNGNGIADRCDVDCEMPGGICDMPGCGQAADCNNNHVPDECDVSWQTSTDYNGDGTPDECQGDCNGNLVPDECDVSCTGACSAAPGCGQSPDCQPDLIPDECQALGAHVPDPPPACTALADYGAPWCDDFESYPLGTIFGYNWEGWGGDPNMLGIVTDEHNHTPGGSKSLKIQVNDTVRLFTGYNQAASAYWVFRAYAFVPSTMSGRAWFILNPNYTGGGPGTTWAVQLTMNAASGLVSNWYGGESLPLVTDAWAEIRCEINFADNLVTVYYNGSLLASYPWTIGGGSLNVAAVDLYSPDSSGFYYDDLSLFPAVGGDCNHNGVPDECDVAQGTSPDANGNGVPDECECSAPAAPVAEPTLLDTGFGTRVRYLAFSPDPGSAGSDQAIRVKFTDLPPPFEYADGRTMWVGEPMDVSEVAGKPDATPPTFKLAELQCDPFFADWTDYGTVYIRGIELVPQGFYDLQAIYDGCDLMAEGDYSTALPIQLSKWGDAVGGNNAASPQGTVDFVDISAVVDKFKNVPGAPTKSRADVAPSLPDRIIDFTDIPAVVDAFKGRPYPYPGPPLIDPCE